jgi:hypothetical protein
LSIFGWTLAVLDILLPKRDGFEYGSAMSYQAKTVSKLIFIQKTAPYPLKNQ